MRQPPLVDRARAAEIGAGTGVGAAWLASALRPGVPLYTAERDRAAVPARLSACTPTARRPGKRIGGGSSPPPPYTH